MKFNKYLKDKILTISLFFLMTTTILLMLLAFKCNISLIVAILLTLFIFNITFILIDYLRKRNFYNLLLLNIERLDKSYLVLETLQKPHFYEGELLYQALYEINKSMLENVKEYEYAVNDFKEYIEMWIHEVKIPLATLVLMAHNHKDNFDKKQIEQIKRLDNYIEQVLYYVRCENAEQDYLITENNLDKIISHIALKNKDDLLENKINLIVKNIDYKVLTDSKWLEFILNQIINNSIKYKRHDTKSYIKISAKQENNKTILYLKDNGIGIPSKDLPRVFNKSFTGHNGRLKGSSTGMGLFIAKNMCKKLGHKIEIKSKEGEYTELQIIFSKDKHYEVVK